MAIELKNVTHVYQARVEMNIVALNNIDLTIEDGELLALIGHTGSGKSTLAQHLNGLLKPTSGKVLIDGEDINENRSKYRFEVGLVFQYPEYQLFEETVKKDIAFGPKNMGLTEDEINQRVKSAMELVGLNYEEIGEKSPFELSGGQMRRVALAGVLAMKPNYLILDEPTAGLDPAGRNEIFHQIKKLHERSNVTVILVSHSMEDIAKLVDRVIVLYKGKVHMQGTPKEIYSEADELERIGLGIPQIASIVRELRNRGFNIKQGILTIEEAKEEILKEVKRRNV